MLCVKWSLWSKSAYLAEAWKHDEAKLGSFRVIWHLSPVGEMAYLWCWPAWRPAYGADPWSGINSRGASWYFLNPVWFMISYKVQYHQSSCVISHPHNVCLIIPMDESSTTGAVTTYWCGNVMGLVMKWADLLIFLFFLLQYNGEFGCLCFFAITIAHYPPAH